MIFDWNDKELANIIWGDADESDDHIVPYPDGSENKIPGSYGDHNKEWEKKAAQVKLTEQNKSAAAIDSDAVKQGHHSQCTTYGGVLATGLNSCPDISPSNSAKVDKSTMGIERLNKTTEISNYESSRSGEGIEFCNQPEDKEERDFVNYDWANIGSFDDLDRIFSSNDQTFGRVSIGNADEPWPSSKNVTTSPEISVSLSLDSPCRGFGALGSKPDQFETKAEHLPDQLWPTPGFQKMNSYSSHSTLVAKDSMINFEAVVGRSQPIVNAKVNRQRKLLKGQKKVGVKSEATILQNFSSSCTSDGGQRQHYDNQIAPDMGQTSSSMTSQQKKFHGPESSQYKSFTSTHLTPESQYPSMPALPLFQSGETNQNVPFNYEVSSGNSNPLNNPLNTARKILSMTPQEKIAKLKSRQKMRAMVAILKQQQQFSHQTSCNDNCISPRCDNQMQLMAGGSREINESLNILPSFNQHSPMEHNGANTVHMNIDKYSIEDTVLHQLQDVINKLGIEIRLCIRDSLFRLAQSSIQRQRVSDTGSTNKSSTNELEVLANAGTNNHKRFGSMPDAETKTNPIDRAVAHLIFHRPLELSGKLAVLESPFPTNLQCGRKSTEIMSLLKAFSSEGYEKDPSVDTPCLFTEGEESKGPCPDTSENASNYETEDCEAKKVALQ